MSLKAVVEKLDDVAEEFRGEYKEVKDAKGVVSYALDLEGNVEAHPAVRTLKDEIARRRIGERTAKEELAKLAPFKALGSPEDVQAKLDRIPELEAAAEGKIDETKLNSMVETRIKAKLAPIERERDALKVQVTERDTKLGEYSVREKQRMVGDQIRAAVAKSTGFQQVALEDAIVFGERMLEVTEEGNVVTKDNIGVTPGVDAAIWLQEMQARKPHWWGTSQGGGAGGGGGKGFGGLNPFSAEHWNMTEQGRVYREDPKRAEKMAASAGTKIGGQRPVKK